MPPIGITQDDVLRALAQVEHPEIARTLMDLGMIGKVDYSPAENTLAVTLILPEPNVPMVVLDRIIIGLRDAVRPLGVNFERVFLAARLDEDRQPAQAM